MVDLGKNKNTLTDSPSLQGEVAAPQFSTGVLPVTLKSGIDKNVWRKFVTCRAISRDQIKTPVTDSWERCLKLGVDPAQKGCDDFLNDNSLQAEHQFFHDLIDNLAGDLTPYLREKELLFTVTDQYGYLADMLGSRKTLNMAHAMQFSSGANWSEQSVGTNAIGTALASGLPVRVIGEEHFRESHHGWVCSAAPIFGINGNLHGCINISGPTDSDHRRGLALAVYYARAVEALLFQQHCMGMIGQVLNKTAIGLLTLDQRGRIYYCNNIASELFGKSLNNLIGKDASHWFNLSPFKGQLPNANLTRSDSMVEISCLYNPTWNVFAAPLINSFQHLQGLTLCISPPAPVVVKNDNIYHSGQDAFRSMIGSSISFKNILRKAQRVAFKNTTVLITGPSGTGKEVMAHALHNASSRAKKPFVAVNCGAIASELIQSELFGYVDGAFTGARRGGQPGKFEQAEAGTIFLDEIGEMPLAMQVNLLRVLDEKQVVRVGGKHPISIDVRIIAATNRNLEVMIEERKFRQDLYYRLHVVSLNLPPLCERENDVLLLADHFIREFAQEAGQEIDYVDPEFREALAAYSWPGNIRELRHVIESTIILMEDNTLRPDSLPKKIRQATEQRQLPGKKVAMHFESLNFDEIQKQALQQALQKFDGNISQVAKALGIGRNTTYAKLKKFKLL